jgi:hypothetical protein
MMQVRSSWWFCISILSFAAFRKLLSIVGGVLDVFIAAWALGSVDTCIGKYERGTCHQYQV